MALINTDWTQELDQVNQSLNKLLHTNVEPMIERTMDRGVLEIEKALDKISVEMQGAINELAQQIEQQRVAFIKDIWKIVLVSFTLLTALSLLIIVII
ncbi:MAG: hypothetical protein U5M23_14280 [Marinagarivorans sp.]|nr:hypothetical protein [Marinagarivorans sp.]